MEQLQAECRQTEDALRKSEERYRLLIEHRNDRVVEVDPEGRFLSVSPSYCNIFGKTEKELLGQRFMPLAHEEDRKHTARAMEALYHPPYTAYMELRAMTRSGWIQNGEGVVLLMDDEAMILKVAQTMLEKLGYQVFTARSGEEAIDLYEKKREEIDLVILDMIMPGMGGGKAFDRLKEIDPKVKILPSSGYSINGQAHEILNRGCRGFIQKPFEMEEFSLKVREVLGKDK